MRPNLFAPFSRKAFILNNSFRGKGWSFNLPPGLPTHRGIQPGRESWPCLRWAKSWALTHVFSFVNWPSIGNIYTMERQRNWVSKMHLCSGWGSAGEYSANKLQEAQVCVQALRASNHGTILSFFEKATPPPKRPHPNKLAQHIHPFAVNRYPWQVPILSNEDCQAKVLGNETIENSMLCAGGAGSGTNKVNYDWIFRGEEHFSVDIFLPGW